MESGPLSLSTLPHPPRAATRQATGAPTNPLTCSTTSGRTVLGSWSPQHRHAGDN